MVEETVLDPEGDDEDLVDWTLDLAILKTAQEKLLEMATVEGLHIEDFVANILEEFVATEVPEGEEGTEVPEGGSVDE